MISMDRETLMMVGTIVAILGVIFLFREMNKAKQDVEDLKGVSTHLIQRLTAPEPSTKPTTEVESEAEVVVEENNNE
jgi:hypothetical protein|tara:strand:+ start:934 stop:1164 length:231 start_codon:yes stop_codon:yes gene_type:complete